MGFAMRLVRYFPRVLVGAGFICQAAMPLGARAWDNPAIEINDEASASPQNNGGMVDPAVKRAGYYDSRPRPNATTIASPESTGNGRNGPLYRGQALHLPKLPFARQQPNNRPANQTNQWNQSNQSTSNQTRSNN